MELQLFMEAHSTSMQGSPLTQKNEQNGYKQNDTPEPKRKYRRFLPVISDDESD